MNVEQRVQALEALLEKVKTNAAKPRPARSNALVAASRATDDVAGPVAVAPVAEPVRTPSPGLVVKAPAAAEDDWSDTTQTFETPVPLAAPIPGPAKSPSVTIAKPSPLATKTPVPGATPKVPETKPVVATPAIKPVVAPPAVKPVVAPPAVKPLVAPAAVKPAAAPNAPIPLTNKVAAPVIKTPAPPIPVKSADVSNINKTLTGVGDGAVKAPDLRAAVAAGGLSSLDAADDSPAIALDKKPLPIKPEPDRKPSLPSAIADSDGEEEENEPTQLYEPSAASRRAAELAAMGEKQLEAAKLDILGDKKTESDKVEIRLPDAKAAAEKIEIDAPKKLDLPWADKKSEPETISALANKPEPPKTETKKVEPEPEIAATEESIDLDEPEAKKPEEKPAEKVETKTVSEDKPAPKPEPKPVVEDKPVVETKPVVAEKKPAFEEPPALVPTTQSKGVPKLLIVAAVVLIIAAGGFVAMKQGLFGGAPPTPTPPTVAPPTTPAATQTAAPTTTATAAPTAEATAAPTASAAAEPAESAAAPVDSAAPAASASAAPAESAAPEPPAAPAGAAPGTPSVDPATLNNNQGLLFVTSNKQARVYLTGKMVGETGAELKVDCGMKFVRLADPAQDLAKPPIWLTPGAPKQIDCRKYTTFNIDVP